MVMTERDDAAKRQQLLEERFCVWENVLDWYHPDFSTLPGPIQGYVARLTTFTPAWNPDLASELTALKPTYEGTEEAIEFARVKLSKRAFATRCVSV